MGQDPGVLRGLQVAGMWVGAVEVRLLVEQGCIHSVWRWIEGLPRESAAVKPLGLGKWDSLGLFPALMLMGCVRG